MAGVTTYQFTRPSPAAPTLPARDIDLEIRLTYLRDLNWEDRS
jgi:hypothetical protein